MQYAIELIRSNGRKETSTLHLRFLIFKLYT